MLTGALVVLGAQQGERQRPGQQIRSLLKRQPDLDESKRRGTTPWSVMRMRRLIVAMEYPGAGAGPRAGSSTGDRQLPAREHAYDPETATLAGHLPGSGPRVEFPSRPRGWNSQPQAGRCPDCDAAVQRIVSDLIATAVTAVTGQFPGA